MTFKGTSLAGKRDLLVSSFLKEYDSRSYTTTYPSVVICIIYLGMELVIGAERGSVGSGSHSSACRHICRLYKHKSLRREFDDKVREGWRV